MKKYNLVLLIISQCFLSFSQFAVKIVNDNFNSNMMRWDIHQNENSEMNIQDGKYLLTCLKEGTAITSTIDAAHLQEHNYSVTASFLKTKGIDDNGYGLVWGSQDANNEYEFVISGNGQFKIIQWLQGNKTEIFPWTYSLAINKWDFSKNILKVQNLNRILRFYINDTYIAAIKELPLLGKRVGMVLNEEMSIEVDYLIIENLTSNEIDISDNSNYLELASIYFQGNSSGDEIKYNETANLVMQVANKGSKNVKDIMVKIESDEPINGLEFNKLIMIENLGANASSTYTLKLDANEELPSRNNVITVSLFNLNGEKIDSKRIYIKTIGVSTYYENNNTAGTKTNESINQDNNISQKNNSNSSYTNKKNVDGCTKGCASVGLVSLILGLILTII